MYFALRARVDRGRGWQEVRHLAYEFTRSRSCWFVIDRQGTLTYASHPTFSGPTAYEKDIEVVLDELKKAAR